MLLINTRLIINPTEKKDACNFTIIEYVIYIYFFYSIVWKLLEFPALGDNLLSCSLKCLPKGLN